MSEFVEPSIKNLKKKSSKKNRVPTKNEKKTGGPKTTSKVINLTPSKEVKSVEKNEKKNEKNAPQKKEKGGKNVKKGKNEESESVEQEKKNENLKRKRDENEVKGNKKKKLNVGTAKETEKKPEKVVEDEDLDMDEEEAINQMIMEEEKSEGSSTTFSFEEDSSQNSESVSSQTSTDLSSTVDEFATQVPEIKVSDEVKGKMKKAIKEKKKKESEIKLSDPRGVVYVGHLPYGFFEDQLRGFFSQFGIVTNLRVSRNKKTGKSRHYCFIEFLDPIVATIVSDTMNGYIMYGRMLKCKVIPPEKVHPKMFLNRKLFHPRRRRIIHAKMHNSDNKDQKTVKKNFDRLISKENKKREKLKQLGVNYDFPGYSKEIESSE